jgi:hypothetical protein
MLEQTRQAPDGYFEMAIHRGQRRALESTKRFVLVLAGWQSGKTVIGPPWMLNEIRACGPGDYLIASPTYPLMQKKVLPEFLRLFKRVFKLGEFSGHPKNCFTFSPKGCKRLFGYVPLDPVQVFLGHAGDPDSLESATLKAAWLDEAGQKGFRAASWDAIQGRLSLNEGRCLLTTRPYDLGWIKQKLYDLWEQAKKNHPYIDIINFRSIDNPSFPRAEWDRAKKTMPPWKFSMAYEGLFTRPPGLVYDCFDSALHVVPRFPLPSDWPRWVGLDFGPVNTAAVFFAEEMAEPHDGLGGPKLPTGRVYAYREYHAGNRSSAEHVKELLKGERGIPTAVGGAPRIEQGWRDAFKAAGLPVKEPDLDRVEPGIDRVYAAFRLNQILVFDDLTELRNELETYSYELDERGEPTDKLEDPHSFHCADAMRYVVSVLKKNRKRAWIGV